MEEGGCDVMMQLVTSVHISSRVFLYVEEIDV
jgi:hypothetical protein